MILIILGAIWILSGFATWIYMTQGWKRLGLEHLTAGLLLLFVWPVAWLILIVEGDEFQFTISNPFYKEKVEKAQGEFRLSQCRRLLKRALNLAWQSFKRFSSCKIRRNRKMENEYAQSHIPNPHTDNCEF